MKISIKDKIFGQGNYECNVYIDGVKQDVGSGRLSNDRKNIKAD